MVIILQFASGSNNSLASFRMNKLILFQSDALSRFVSCQKRRQLASPNIAQMEMRNFHLDENQTMSTTTLPYFNF